MSIPTLDDTLNLSERTFGKGTIMTADGDALPDIETFPSGLPALDDILGIGGLPKGRIIEIFGTESAGKTTMALSAIAQAQKQGAIAAFVDVEHALDLRYVRDLGVDCSKMLLSQPDCGEQAMDVVEALVRSGQVGVVVVDSVAALTPKAEIDGEMGDNHVGLQARLMSRAMRKLASLAHQSATTIIFINKCDDSSQSAGNALKFYSSVRLLVQKQAGDRVRIKVVKNKFAPPFRSVDVGIIPGQGYDVASATQEIAEWVLGMCPGASVPQR